jgi:Ca2+:H+ antiporter
LLVATAGSLLPAALVMSNELRQDQTDPERAPSESELSAGAPSKSELAFCRVNAVIMMTMYICYLLFQVGTHKEEFDEAGTLHFIFIQ